MMDITHVILHTNWEWPGDKAILWYVIISQVAHGTCTIWQFVSPFYVGLRSSVCSLHIDKQ